MKLQKHWYLGFLALIGIYKLPLIIGALQWDASLLALTNLLWFAWLTFLIPTRETREPS